MTLFDQDQALPASVPVPLARALDTQGYTSLTPVQLAMLDEGRAAADLLVSAQTGSGKTVAFGLAIATTLLAGEDHLPPPDQPLGLVVAPTRELAMQVHRELAWLYANADARFATCVGGMDMRTERRALERGAHVVVGTPGRLRDHIMKGSLDLGALRAVVLDEADEMLDLGFRDDLEFILGAAPEQRRTLMFSATVPRAIAELAKTYQRDAVRVVATASTEPHADIEYQLMITHRDEREHAIINTLLFSNSTSALVFCHTREAVRHLTARLANRGFMVVSLSGEMAQSERSSALQSMRDGRARVCVATDVAARGIDLPNLDLVIHADLPSKPDTLLHRSGRTGRAGRKGISVLIVPEHRRFAAERVLSIAKLSASLTSPPDIAAIEARYRQQIVEAATSAPLPSENETAFVAELLERLTPQQLAAAYLRQQLAARPAPEEITSVKTSAGPVKAPKRDKRKHDNADARAPRMLDGVWFTLSLGRKHRADPKWLLPMICKAGGVTKADVGSIKIDDLETRFEITADKAEAFCAPLAGARLEKGVRIASAADNVSGPAVPKSHQKPREKGTSSPAPHAPTSTQKPKDRANTRSPSRAHQH